MTEGNEWQADSDAGLLGLKRVTEGNEWQADSDAGLLGQKREKEGNNWQINNDAGLLGQTRQKLRKESEQCEGHLHSCRPGVYRGFPTRMVYLYNDIQSRYTILVGNPRYVQ